MILKYHGRIKNSAKPDLKKIKRSNLKDNFQDIIDQLKKKILIKRIKDLKN